MKPIWRFFLIFFLLLFAFLISGCLVPSQTITETSDGRTIITQNNWALIDLEATPGPYGRIRYSGADHLVLCPHCYRRRTHEVWCPCVRYSRPVIVERRIYHHRYYYWFYKLILTKFLLFSLLVSIGLTPRLSLQRKSRC